MLSTISDFSGAHRIDHVGAAGVHVVVDHVAANHDVLRVRRVVAAVHLHQLVAASGRSVPVNDVVLQRDVRSVLDVDDEVGLAVPAGVARIEIRHLEAIHDQVGAAVHVDSKHLVATVHVGELHLVGVLGTHGDRSRKAPRDGGVALVHAVLHDNRVAASRGDPLIDRVPDGAPGLRLAAVAALIVSGERHEIVRGLGWRRHQQQQSQRAQ